ncbi:hypothetical protein D3C87_1728270 [compost metagenome]
MAGALFMTDENMLDVILLENLVIDRKNGAAWVTEEMFDAIVLQSAKHDFGACHPVAVIRRVRHVLSS